MQLWENFKNKKRKHPELVHLFTKIIESRHKVAHHEVALKWSKELLGRDFRSHQKVHTMIQTDLIDILKVLNESKEVKPFLEYISAIRSIGDIVTGYIGLYDNFIYNSRSLQDK